MSDQKHTSQRVDAVSTAILTVSDTRTEATDKSGKLIQQRLSSAGHTLHSYAILPDDPTAVRQHVTTLCQATTCQAVLINGGTGISARDTTIEAIEDLIEKRLDGFGELFRILSFDDIGAHAILSRATAGVCQDTALFAMPGSPAAVELAMDRLIIPSLPHLVGLLRSV